MPSFRPILAGLSVLLAGCAGAAPGTQPAPPPAETVDRWAPPSFAPPTPITREEFAVRRAALSAEMEDGVLLVFGAPEPLADYLPFAQEPGFRYLTGVVEPGAVLAVHKQAGRVSERIFVLPRNPAQEVWEGARLGAEGAQARTGILSRTTHDLPSALDSLLAGVPRLYTTAPLPEAEGLLDTFTLEQQIVTRVARRYPRLRVISLDGELERLRSKKSAAEVDRIRRAAHITTLAHRAAVRTIEPGMNEFEIEALIEYMFRRHGAERPAFASIVGSGPNSTTLHYKVNDRFMQAGEVVVMDVGASYDGYAADVTRTVPVSGQFSPDQRAIYEVVLAAQKAAEATARPSATWQQLEEAAVRVMAQGLARLGLIESPGATYRCNSPRFGEICPQYRLYYMHGLGHGIGLEVHDPDAADFSRFQVGSAFTIEPGIYVRADALDHLPDTPENRAMKEQLRPSVERYRNIGVRIEDDYVITPTGAERLSAGIPREAAELEALARLPGVSTPERRPEAVEWYRKLH